MFEIAPGARTEAARLYLSAEIFFPLIGAVLDGNQDGWVFGDAAADPAQVYVEHASGYAQFFGRPNPAFEAALADYLAGGAFRAPKARLYAPRLPDFLASGAFDEIRSERQRFRLLDGPTPPTEPVRDGVIVRSAEAADLGAIEEVFGAIRRFWRDEAGFLSAGRPSLVIRNGAIAALCYAAAEADQRAEIDVGTHPEMRRGGFGLMAASHFVAQSRAAGIEPLWDCFSNNAGSMGLAAALGYRPFGAPYSFFTFAR